MFCVYSIKGAVCKISCGSDLPTWVHKNKYTEEMFLKNELEFKDQGLTLSLKRCSKGQVYYQTAVKRTDQCVDKRLDG